VCVCVYVKNVRLSTRCWVCADNYKSLSVCLSVWDMSVYVRMYALVHGGVCVCVCVCVCMYVCMREHFFRIFFDV
jgi:hypothetical protein